MELHFISVREDLTEKLVNISFPATVTRRDPDSAILYHLFGLKKKIKKEALVIQDR